MADELPINWQQMNLAEDDASTQGTRALRFMVQRIHEAQGNPSLRPTLQSLFMAHDMSLTHNDVIATDVPSTHEDKREERELERGGNRSIDSPQRRSSRSPRRSRRPLEQIQRSEEEGSSSRHSIRTSSSKRRRSPSPCRSPTPSRRRGSERGRSHQCRRRTPTPSDSSSSSDSSDASRGGTNRATRRPHRRRMHTGRKAQKFKEGGKNVTFITYDGSYGQTDKLLNFIQQFDAAFGGEDFTESSKLRHVSMYL